MSLRLLACSLLLLAGCPSTDASSTVESSIQVPLGGLDRSCTGGGRVATTDGRSTTWTASSDGVACHLEVTWEGELLDMTKVRHELDEQLRSRGSSLDKVDVTFTSIDVTFHHAALDPSVPLDNVALRIAVGQDLVIQRRATSIDHLFDGEPVALSGATVAFITAAFRQGTPIRATGSTSLDVPLAALPSEPRATTLTVSLTLAVNAHVTLKSL